MKPEQNISNEVAIDWYSTELLHFIEPLSIPKYMSNVYRLAKLYAKRGAIEGLEFKVVTDSVIFEDIIHNQETPCRVFCGVKNFLNRYDDIYAESTIGKN